MEEKLKERVQGKEEEVGGKENIIISLIIRRKKEIVE